MRSRLKNNTSHFSLDSLKGRQSVRATFTLSKQTIKLLSMVAGQLGIKQKSIFDHLAQDKQMLYQVAREVRKKKPDTGMRRQKTYVLTRNTLICFDTVARECRLPRDLLIEGSIKGLLPVMDAEKKRHENRKSLLLEMENFSRQGDKMMEKALLLVGENDPVSRQLEDILSRHRKNLDDLRQIIEKGKCMEDF